MNPFIAESNISKEITEFLESVGSIITPLGLARIATKYLEDDDCFIEHLEKVAKEIIVAEYVPGKYFLYNGNQFKVLEVITDDGSLFAADTDGQTHELDLYDMDRDLNFGIVEIIENPEELDWENVLSDFADKLYAKGFTDTSDATPGICLHDKGIMRNPKTNIVIYCVPLHTQSTDKDPVMAYTEVTREEVVEDLCEEGTAFFDFIGSTLEKELALIEKFPDSLCGMIETMNMFNGKYQQFEPCEWNETIETLRRFL